MENVILAVHILACIAMTVVVLLQRSEGGALGMGGGTGSMMTGRGAAGALVRTTMIFGGIFFLTSLVLTTMASRDPERSAVERAAEADGGPAGVAADLLDPETDLTRDPLLARPGAGDGDPLAEGDGTESAPATDPLAEGTDPADGSVDPFAEPEPR